VLGIGIDPPLTDLTKPLTLYIPQRTWVFEMPIWRETNYLKIARFNP